jgi:hypothetical protein
MHAQKKMGIHVKEKWSVGFWNPKIVCSHRETGFKL